MNAASAEMPASWSPTQLLSPVTPPRQIVRTQMEDILWCQYSIPAVERMGDVDYVDELTGFCPVLAIDALVDGIEDGIIMKKEAIDRGMGAYIVVNNCKVLTPYHPDILLTRPPKSALRKRLADNDAHRHLEPNGRRELGTSPQVVREDRPQGSGEDHRSTSARRWSLARKASSRK